MAAVRSPVHCPPSMAPGSDVVPAPGVSGLSKNQGHQREKEEGDMESSC